MYVAVACVVRAISRHERAFSSRAPRKPAMTAAAMAISGCWRTSARPSSISASTLLSATLSCSSSTSVVPVAHSRQRVRRQSLRPASPGAHQADDAGDIAHQFGLAIVGQAEQLVCGDAVQPLPRAGRADGDFDARIVIAGHLIGKIVGRHRSEAGDHRRAYRPWCFSLLVRGLPTSNTPGPRLFHRSVCASPVAR